MGIDQIEKICAFTGGEIIRGDRDEVCAIAFTKGDTSFEFLFSESSLRLALRIWSDTLTIHFEFPADEVEEVELPEIGSSLIFRESHSKEQLLSLTRTEHGYFIDPVVPFLATEVRR